MEEHDLLTHTGPGTPCGELMRRYCQPTALSEELSLGGAPFSIRLLGKANRYQQHRESIRSESYNGIDKWNFPAQDLCVTEGPGPVQDRTREHLMPCDQPLRVPQAEFQREHVSIAKGV